MNLHIINSFFGDIDPTDDDVENAKYHAGLGNADAQYHLALMYDTGRGVQRNPREAERFYKMAAQHGHAQAAYFLAKLYSTDNSGIRRDNKEAEKWFEIAQQKI